MGDQFRVSRLAWSRDNRHLVSLDSRFEIRVWDRERGEPAAIFRERPTDFFAMNAAVALSDDGRLLAYASGGESRAAGNIREVATGKVCSSWELPGGYERLACTGGNNFLLIREEIEENKATTRTAARDLSPGRPINLPRVIRRSEPGDVRRFFGHDLSADGRYYWWSGPRLTPWNRRVEVYDVKANVPLFRLPWPTREKIVEIGSQLSPDGRILWYGDTCGTIRKCALAQPQSSVAVAFSPIALSSDGRWSITLQPERVPPLNDCLILGCGWHAEKDWLAFGERDAVAQAPDKVCFSPDSHYLAWGDAQGTVHIADLHFLNEKVRAFAEEILAD
jgi:WD40 repeat protein